MSVTEKGPCTYGKPGAKCGRPGEVNHPKYSLCLCDEHARAMWEWLLTLTADALDDAHPIHATEPGDK